MCVPLEMFTLLKGKGGCSTPILKSKSLGLSKVSFHLLQYDSIVMVNKNKNKNKTSKSFDGEYNHGREVQNNMYTLYIWDKFFYRLLIYRAHAIVYWIC